jgi:hypothetical protein
MKAAIPCQSISSTGTRSIACHPGGFKKNRDPPPGSRVPPLKDEWPPGWAAIHASFICNQEQKEQERVYAKFWAVQKKPHPDMVPLVAKKPKYTYKRMGDLELGDIVLCSSARVNGKITNLFRRGDRVVHASCELDFDMGRVGILLKEDDTIQVLVP